MSKTLKEWKQHISESYFGYSGIDVEHFFQFAPENRDKIVVNIPARSGSQRVSDKNISEICGIPLMAYTIEVALQLPVDRVIVNTDSRRFARVAEQYGAEVPFLRPPELSTAEASPGLASYYLERQLLSQGYPVGTVIDMYPTSLFRNVKTISGYVEALNRSGHFATAVLPDVDLHRVYSEQGRRLRVEGCEVGPGQVPFKLVASFMGKKLANHEMRWFNYQLMDNPIELIDLDTPEDVQLAECIIENGLYDFGVGI